MMPSAASPAAPRSAYFGIDSAAVDTVADETSISEWHGLVEEEQFRRLRKCIFFVSLPAQAVAGIAALICVAVLSEPDSLRATLCTQKLDASTGEPMLRCDTHWSVGYTIPVPLLLGAISDALLLLTLKSEHRLMLYKQETWRRWLEYLVVHAIFFLQLSSFSGMNVFSQVVAQTMLFATAHLCLIMPFQAPVIYGLVLWLLSSGLLLESFVQSFIHYATWLQAYLISALCLLSVFPVLRLVQLRFVTSSEGFLRMEMLHLFCALGVRTALTFQLFAALRFK